MTFALKHKIPALLHSVSSADHVIRPHFAMRSLFRIFLRGIKFHALIVEVEIGGVANYRKEVHSVLGSGNFPFFQMGRTRRQQH
ncbi:hypothetical protein TNCV_2675031 [Trichonephila clavipes]|nr:hypothetical protein TNCV_2675031 [Trichonephila clavipes]